MNGLGRLTSGTARRAAGWPARWLGTTSTHRFSPARRLALALALSLLLHALVLALLRGGRSSRQLPDVLQVTLVLPSAGDIQVVPAPPRPAPVTPAPAVHPRPEQPVPAPAAAVAAAATGTAPVQRPAQAEPARGETSQADRPARPLSWPLIDADLRRQLVARRLQLRLQVEADGTVVRAEFRHHELSPTAVRALEEAVSHVSFQPAARDGKATAEVLDTRLCFDDEGQFDQRSPECWGLPQR